MSHRDLHNTINALSMVNAGLQSTAQYITDSKAGNPYATSNFIFNLAGSTARIGMADHLARHTGNYLGYTFNSIIPYTDTSTNLFALGATSFMTPWSGMYGIGCRLGYTPMMSWGFPMVSFGHHHCHSSYSSISIRSSSFFC